MCKKEIDCRLDAHTMDGKSHIDGMGWDLHSSRDTDPEEDPLPCFS